MELEHLRCGWRARLLVVLPLVAPAGCATWDGEIDRQPVPPSIREQPIYPGLPAKASPARVALSPNRLPAPVKPVRHEEPGQEPAADKGKAAAVPAAPKLPTPPPPPGESSPIDLPTALRLAGANNLQIALANERLRQAEARLDGATALWLPSVNLGAGYNSHSGRVQDTSGQIVDVDRSSLFLGGGPVVGNFPLPGGAGPPPRLFLGLPVADAVFTRLAERQQVAANRAGTTATFNDTLLQVGMAYLDLVSAHQQVAIAGDALTNAKELDRLVESRVKAGTTLPADGFRAKAEVADRERQLRRAEEWVRVASAELGRLLRLDPGVLLVPAETQPALVELISPDAPLMVLLEQGLTARPELAQNQALVRASLERLRLEKWRPWIPSVAVGYSAGGFGGGAGSEVGRFGGRSDFDAVLAWEFRNLGLGNRALQRERSSVLAQANLTAEQTRDNIMAEIVRAYHQARLRREQVEAAGRQLAAAAEALPLNFKGIVGGNLRAIEGQQAVQALAAAQTQYLTSVTEYNQAQFQLLRAIGQPPEAVTDPNAAGRVGPVR
jgi:outer membrane protein TolC